LLGLSLLPRCSLSAEQYTSQLGESCGHNGAQKNGSKGGTNKVKENCKHRLYPVTYSQGKVIYQKKPTFARIQGDKAISALAFQELFE
jgi:hypothetical protein